MPKSRADAKSFLPPRLGARLAELRGNARHAAAFLKAMSNTSRLLILCRLAEGERSVGELEREVGLSQSGISQHLAVLRREQVVVTRRDRQMVYYSLAGTDVTALMCVLHDIFCSRQKPARARLKAAR